MDRAVLNALKQYYGSVGTTAKWIDDIPDVTYVSAIKTAIPIPTEIAQVLVPIAKSIFKDRYIANLQDSENHIDHPEKYQDKGVLCSWIQSGFDIGAIEMVMNGRTEHLNDIIALLRDGVDEISRRNHC
jgi:hypothetical protein